MLRDRLRTRRDEFLSFVLPHSDPASNVTIVDPTTGAELTVYRTRTGHELGLAAYPAAGRALYRVKVAHALALLLVGASVALSACGRSDAAPQPAPAPVERESHAWTVGAHESCEVTVSTMTDGAVWAHMVALGRKDHGWHGPYKAGAPGNREARAVDDMIARFGRDC